MRLILFYMALAAGIYGISYAIPELRMLAIKHKKRAALAFALPFLIITFVYFMEVVVNG